ncbi:MAG TPA: porin [Bacteroidales bacterium]|nr:porin [Bacteroidales bacterium]
MKSRLQILTSTLLLIAGLALLGITPAYAQDSDSLRIDELEGRVKKLEVLKGLKVSGYIQGQYQYGDVDASLNVGSKNTSKDEGYHRMGIRRGRIKFTYDKSIASAVFQLDLTEKGVSFKDVYMQIKDPKFSASSIKVGVFDRPFGYEITYSSSSRETPERSQIFRTLFPNERDLGVMVTLQPKKGSAWNILKKISLRY